MGLLTAAVALLFLAALVYVIFRAIR